MNKVILIGRLARAAEIRRTQTGKSVATFTLAVDRPYQKDKPKEADFINCVCWDKRGEAIAQYTAKGHRISVEGRLQVRQYETKDGKKATLTEVIVNDFEFLQGRTQQQQDGQPFVQPVDDEEIPF